MTVMEWAADTHYTIGTVVMYNDILFKCLQSHISTCIYTPTFYQHILWTNNTYAIQSDIPIIIWRPDIYYFKDSIVEFYGHIYKCQTSHLSVQFHSPMFTIGTLWNHFPDL